mgnify:CR=1 FL=1
MSERIILPHVKAMTGFNQRLWGLIKEPETGPTQGFWFPRCASIHTLGMKAPIDVVGLNQNQQITAVKRHLCPASVQRFSQCTSILELGYHNPWPFEQWLGQTLIFVKQGAPSNEISASTLYFAIAVNIS